MASIKGQSSTEESTSLRLISPKILLSILIAAALSISFVGEGADAVGNLDFNPPTPVNNSYVNNNWTEVNLSITSNNISSFIFNWNGTNYSVYDESTIIHLSFNNNSAIGENDTIIVDTSRYEHNGTIVGSENISWTQNGKYGGGFNFTGNPSYLDFGNITDNIDYTKNFTVCHWANPNQPTGTSMRSCSFESNMILSNSPGTLMQSIWLVI